MDSGSPATPYRIRVRRGRWRRSHFRRIDDSSRGDGAGLGGDGVEGLLGLYDGMERRASRRWLQSAVLFLAGVTAAASMIWPSEEGFGSLGWMAWGCAGALAGAGFWLAALPYRGRAPAKAFRACAVVAALAPIALHLLGAI